MSEADRPPTLSDAPAADPSPSAVRSRAERWSDVFVSILFVLFAIARTGDRPPRLSDAPAANPSPSAARSRAVRIARWSGVFVSFLAVLFAIGTYFEVWNHLRGDTQLADLAARLDSSYAQVSRQVRPGDQEWRPLIRVIKTYTRAALPRDRKPVMFMRDRAIVSFQQSLVGNEIAEWTAPTTPIMLLYRDVYDQHTLPPNDVVIVGTIQDLHDWIRRDETDFDFRIRTILFGLLSALVGTFLALRT
jgi:hypothetical protein